jgi:hypothetical protein
MYLLVLVFALSVVALLAAAWAIRRSIQRHGRKKEQLGLGLSQTKRTPGSATDDPDEHERV